MYLKCLFFYILFIIPAFLVNSSSASIRRHGRRENSVVEDVPSGAQTDANVPFNDNEGPKNRQCWMRLNSKKHFDVMEKLDKRYAEVRKQYQEASIKDNLDQQMQDVMIKTRGAAEREIQRAAGDSRLIPAGINLGGYFMMRMPSSLLFFHRMKLRNNTHFHVTYLHNDLANMTLQVHLSLNDLHLVGSFDRSITDKDPSILFYTPTYGQVEILLKNVQFKFEGRYRLLKDKLTIELIISDIDFDDALLTYLNNGSGTPMRLRKTNIDGFLVRLKSDLDKWVKDYFNDYLMYFGLVGKNSNNKFQQYDKEKALELNDYFDQAINSITERLHELKTEAVKLPKFTIYTSNSMELLLKEGVLRGLDSMYRRSVATGKKIGSIRKVDAVVGFSNLKVTYEYEALLATNAPVLSGVLVLSADELTARMGVTAAEGSESVDIQFDFIEQAKPESLTIEGAANRMISNFKYVLEQHVTAIMSNTLLHNVKMLESLTRCVPLLAGHQEPNIVGLEEEDLGNEDKPVTPDNHKETDANTTPVNVKTEEADSQSEGDVQVQSQDRLVNLLNPSDSNIRLEEVDSADIELPPHDGQPKHRMHLKYEKNLTLTKLD